MASKGVTIELLHTDGTTVSIPSAQLHHQNGTFHINAKKETKLKTTFTSGAAIQHMTLGKGTFVEGRESLNEAVVVLECDTLKRNVVVSMSQIEDVAKATNKDLSENDIFIFPPWIIKVDAWFVPTHMLGRRDLQLLSGK